ncbi:MAG: hypothetical protein ACTS3F_01110 [Phycisphaerales bacterium]
MSMIPNPLPAIRLLDRSPPPPSPWMDAIAIVALALGITMVLALVGAMVLRSRKVRRNPRGAATGRLTRVHRLTADDRRLLDLAASRSRVDRLAMLVAPSAFDRAMAQAEISSASVSQLRARLFGPKQRRRSAA